MSSTNSSDTNLDEKVCEWCRQTFPRVNPSTGRADYGLTWAKRKYCSHTCGYAAQVARSWQCGICKGPLKVRATNGHLKTCDTCKESALYYDYSKNKRGKAASTSFETANKIVTLLLEDEGARLVWQKMFGRLDLFGTPRLPPVTTVHEMRQRMKR